MQRPLRYVTRKDLVNTHFGAGQSRLDWAVLLLAMNSHCFKTSWSILDWPVPKCMLTVSIVNNYVYTAGVSMRRLRHRRHDHGQLRPSHQRRLPQEKPRVRRSLSFSLDYSVTIGISSCHRRPKKNVGSEFTWTLHFTGLARIWA